MSRSPTKTSLPRRLVPAVTSGKFVREIDQFFQARDPLHKTMRRLANHLSKAKIPYAVVGGMAVYAQGYRRTSDDLDILLTREGLLTFRRLFVSRYYEPLPLRPRRLIDPVSGVAFDVLV